VRDDRERLLDIREAIERIERYARHGRNEFDANELIQVWIVRHLEIIGEAVRGLTTEFTGQHPEVPWKYVAAMRNVLAHEYFDIDLDEVWAVAERELPALRSRIAAILEQR
jgi:uncharacterized protein with HEPN domain